MRVAIPDFQTVMRPILVALDRAPEALSPAQVRDAVAQAVEVTSDERKEMLPSGRQTIFANRIAWATTHMAKAGLVHRPRRGYSQITDLGRQVLRQHPDRVDMTVLNEFPDYRAFRAIKQDKPVGLTTPDPIVIDEVSPSEAVGELIEQSYKTLAEELLDRILAQPPSFLENLALKLLRGMGYGGRESLLEHTGRSGDAGLDGIVRQDALGLDLVGVQAKRFDREQTVGRPEIQAFVGALQGAQTTRGVFVTTARFTAGARQFAENVAMRLRLIDGQELTRMMVRYNIGVQVRETFDLKEIDEETFED